MTIYSDPDENWITQMLFFYSSGYLIVSNLSPTLLKIKVIKGGSHSDAIKESFWDPQRAFQCMGIEYMEDVPPPPPPHFFYNKM